MICPFCLDRPFYNVKRCFGGHEFWKKFLIKFYVWAIRGLTVLFLEEH